jgi:DNA/RNA endonuclease G (NUC1)
MRFKIHALRLWMASLAVSGCARSSTSGAHRAAHRPSTGQPGALHSGQSETKTDSSAIDVANQKRPANLTLTPRAVTALEHLAKDDEKMLRFLCPFGAPRLHAQRSHGQTAYLVRRGYGALYSTSRKVPLWVCERVMKNELAVKAVPLRGRFRNDPMLLMFSHSTNRDYDKSGYARGQLASPGSHRAESTLRRETYFMSNVAPQKPGLKKGLWRALDAWVRKWAQRWGGVYSISGTLVVEEKNSATGRGYISIGAQNVIVPTHFFRIVVTGDKTGRVRLWAVVAENRSYSKPYDWTALTRSVAWIEKQAGIDFLPGLSPAVQRRLEATPQKFLGAL